MYANLNGMATDEDSMKCSHIHVCHQHEIASMGLQAWNVWSYTRQGSKERYQISFEVTCTGLGTSQSVDLCSSMQGKSWYRGHREGCCLRPIYYPTQNRIYGTDATYFRQIQMFPSNFLIKYISLERTQCGVSKGWSIHDPLHVTI